MHNSPRARTPVWPLNICPACGGDWFRQADYYQFRREETLGSSWETWPDLVEQLSIGPMGLLICLCGSPLRSSIGGVRGGRTPNSEVSQFMNDCQRAKQLLREAHKGDSLLRAAARQLATLETWQALADRLRSVERELARRMRSGRGRPWSSPTRQPAAQGRDRLVLALEAKAGLTSRKAKSVVN